MHCTWTTYADAMQLCMRRQQRQEAQASRVNMLQRLPHSVQLQGLRSGTAVQIRSSRHHRLCTYARSCRQHSSDVQPCFAPAPTLLCLHERHSGIQCLRSVLMAPLAWRRPVRWMHGVETVIILLQTSASIWSMFRPVNHVYRHQLRDTSAGLQDVSTVSIHHPVVRVWTAR